MAKRPADIIISTPASQVRRRLNFDSPYGARAVVPIALFTKEKASFNSQMKRKPRMPSLFGMPPRSKGFGAPVKVHSFYPSHGFSYIGKFLCVSVVTRGPGLTQSAGKRFWGNSGYGLGTKERDENIKTIIHPDSVMFFLVRHRRPTGSPQDFGEVFNMFDNEPSTATVKNMHRDRYQVLRKWHATVTGGTYASKEQALVRKFVRVNNYVVYNQQEASKYENHTENALMLYMDCTHASNPVYATLKIRIYFYDSVTN
uniref:Capsid protein n=1 Tax=Tomato leaf curl New Delhi virus-Chilli pepper TaxID=311379 RepID=D5LGK0_9GEMI|nr:coat protein [Tomato leaf curl New Delhi virus-Chilli pepper]